MAASDKLTAWKDGKSQQFSARQWEAMGSFKYGWILEVKKPRELEAVPVQETPTQVAPSIAKKKKKR